MIFFAPSRNADCALMLRKALPSQTASKALMDIPLNIATRPSVKRSVRGEFA